MDGLWEGDDLSAEIWLIPAEEIRALNKRERGVDRVTDVLSFPSMDDIRTSRYWQKNMRTACGRKTEPCFWEASSFVSSARREQAEEYGHSFERELWYLAVHGLLHCLDMITRQRKNGAKCAKKKNT